MEEDATIADRAIGGDVEREVDGIVAIRIRDLEGVAVDDLLDDGIARNECVESRIEGWRPAASMIQSPPGPDPWRLPRASTFTPSSASSPGASVMSTKMEPFDTLPSAATS